MASLTRKVSQLTRDRMNTRPFMRIGVSMSMVNRFKETEKCLTLTDGVKS